MTHLTDPQRQLLEAAAGAADGTTDAPEDGKSARALIRKGLALSIPTTDGPSRLMITEAGRAAIGPAAGAPATEASSEHAAEDAPLEEEPPPAALAKKAPGGKLGALVALLQRSEGATLEAMTEATGWQAHSVRGAMSGSLKKGFGYVIASEKTKAGRIYRIDAAVAV